MRRALLPLLLLLPACDGSVPGEGRPDFGDSGPDAGSGGGGGGGSGACGPASCDGCCDGDTCRDGQSDDSCGAGGAACQACGRWGECSEAHICELADATRWNVVAESGTASALNRSGGAWDGPGDPPDVYAEAWASDGGDSYRSQRTDTHSTTTPIWHQTLFTDLPGSALEGMHIGFYESDGGSFGDPFGDCVAAIRLEDVEAGALELTCPRGLGPAPTRAGWTIRLRLEPRSAGRPGAPAFDRHAAAPRGEPGSCAITHDPMTGTRIMFIHDSWGREVRQEWSRDDGEMGVSRAYECPTADHCEVPGERFTFRRLEPGPFGLRDRITGYDVLLYDSLGRLAAVHNFGFGGVLTGRDLFLHTAKRKVWRSQSFDSDPFDGEIETIEYDEHGSPLRRVEIGRTYEVELGSDGLPVRYEVVESDRPDTFPVGSGFNLSYEGAGCAEVLAVRETNGLVSR